MCISKTSARSVLSALVFASLCVSAQAQVPSPMAMSPDQVRVIDNQYPEPSKITLPSGEVVEMTIRTLAEMQKKSEIRDFEEKVESIFAPEPTRNAGFGVVGNINGFPINLPPPAAELQPAKPPEPEFVMEDRSIRVVSIYGKKQSLMTEIQTADGLLNVGENSNLIAGYRVGAIFSSGVELIGPKGAALVPAGSSISYQVKVKK